MKKMTKEDLLAKAKQLHQAGHENLHATHDGYFFTDPDNAHAHAKAIDSVVHKFDPSELSGNDPGTLRDPLPEEPAEKADTKQTLKYTNKKGKK